MPKSKKTTPKGPAAASPTPSKYPAEDTVGACALWILRLPMTNYQISLAMAVADGRQAPYSRSSVDSAARRGLAKIRREVERRDTK